MTEKEAQRELARVAAHLDTAIEQLVTAPAAVEGWPAALKAAFARLENSGMYLPRADKRVFRPLLATIEQRLKQVHALVDSAALFYCGCVAVTTTHGAGYTHEGSLEQFVVSGRMQLEA